MAEEMLARSYQVHIERHSTKQNTIIYLPTGSGKTFIAVQIIKRLQKDIQPLYSAGGKRTFFLVNSVVLVEQQVKVLRDLTNLSIEGYTSQNKVDLWKLSDWLKELEKTQVLVMTAQILVDMLHHNYISLHRINLLVFDECHHAVDKHPMRLIMMNFEGVQKEKQPKVIGLTATLLNKNLKPSQVFKEIRELEKTFNSIICTTDPEHIAEVFSFSTNPEEFVIPCDGYNVTNAEKAVQEVLVKLQEVANCVKIDQVTSPSKVPFTQKMKPPQEKVKKFISNMVKSLFRYLDDFGMYGSSLSILAYIVLCERLKLSTDTTAKHHLLQVAITSLNKARAILEQAMAADRDFQKIYRHSSPKVRQVMEVLKEYSPRVMDSGVPLKYNKHKEVLSAMVFVQERFACKVLSTILRHASRHCEDLAFLKVDFAVGFNLNPFSDTREGLYEKKQNKAVIMKYASQQLNCLVTTEMMEEGMDVPRCTLVLRYDPVVNFRSYVQAKGRGRHKKAVYAMLVLRDDYAKFLGMYKDYRDIEQLLNNVLMYNTESRIIPTDAEMDEKYKAMCPPYVYKDASITIDTATNVLHRYCNSLPQDKFTIIQPEWFMQMINNDRYQITILLPSFCPHKEPIKGVPLVGLKNAKKAAALKACEILHRVGELTDKLLPRERYDEDLDPAIEETFFSHWRPEEAAGDKAAQLGTKKNKRIYKKKLPACLSGDAENAAFPRSYYLHEIIIRPEHEARDENSATIYRLLEEKRGFSLLTQRPLVELCPFTLFMSSGEVAVDIKHNQKRIRVNEQQFEVMKRFHALVFVDVLGVQKSFMAYDRTLGDNHYLVVPSVGSGETLTVSWDTMATYRSLEPQQEPSVDERRATPVNAAHYYCSVVEPWYRAGMQTRYIVTKACEYMSPHSPFCDPSIESFAAYYQMKYKLSVLGSPDQPMLQVRYLSGKMNALLPRSVTLHGRNKRKDRNEPKTDEFLVPEFCIRYSFPGLLWLKATLLPSILHRLTMILQAEELRHSIAVEAGLGAPRLPPGMAWEQLRADAHAVSRSQQNELALPAASPPVKAVAMDVDAELTAPGTILREDNYRLGLKKLEQEFPWEVNMEPIDIDRNFDTITVMDIECYERFVQLKVMQAAEAVRPGKLRCEDSIKSARAICAPPYKYIDTIDILARAPTALGPQLSLVLEALVVAKSNDIFNLERLETLGDSFLKFSVSLYLMHRYPRYHEGQLTSLKGKIVSNKNLYYCGLEKDIPCRMKVECFTPKTDWLVPAFCVPRPVQDLFNDAEVCPSVLYSLDLPRSEILSGQPSSASWERLTEAIGRWAEAETTGQVEGMDMFLGRQAVQDKVVSDSVEALIGVYLLDGGVRAALRLLQWLRVLPTEENVCDMLDKRIATALSEGSTSVEQVHFNLDNTVPQIEAIVGYKFKDPCLLLQALSHSSNMRNRITDSYQRLEFLGDAVLDFLVTCHLYERCGALSPGDLTDLRSALVNNNTLACLAVRLGLHKFLQSSNVTLDSAIAKFVHYQTQREHLIDEGVLFLLQEEDCNLAEYIEVPKALGDILESMVGAVFLDCGGDLARVWKVFYAIMHREIALFSEKVPKNPVRLLHENIHAAPQFLSSETLTGGMVMIPLQLRVNGKARVVHGFGKNKAQARRAASKIALRMLDVANC